MRMESGQISCQLFTKKKGVRHSSKARCSEKVLRTHSCLHPHSFSKHKICRRTQENALLQALRKSPAGKAQKAAQKMADEYNKVQAEAAQARKTLEQYALSLGYTLKGNETNHQLEQVIKKILDDSIITPTVESSEPEPTTVSVWFDVPSKEQKRSNKNVKKTTKKRNNYKTAKKPTETATKAKIETKPTRLEYTHDLSEFPSMSSASQHQFKRGILRAQ